MFPPALHRFADSLLAGGVAVSGVNVIDAEVEAPPHHRDGLLLSVTLDGDSTKPQPRNHHSGAPESEFVHARSFLPSDIREMLIDFADTTV